MSRSRSSFFFNPVKSGAVVWATSSLALLIPACIKLVPLGNAKNDAKDARDAAQDAVDSTQDALTQTEEQIALAKQRKIDIGCAIKSYQSFNDRISSFWAGISSSTLSPSSILDAFWNLSMIPDQVTQNTQSVTKSYEVTTDVLVPVTTCDKNGCTTTYIWESETNTYDYTETTTITFNDKNILLGAGITAVAPLDCGYYSRYFQTLDPAFVTLSTTDPQQTGSKESGTVYIAYTENRGSELPVHFYLDGLMTNNTIVSPTSASQSDAVLSVASGLFSFLTTAVGVFNATGANYPQIQINIQNNITSLIEQAASLNQTLQSQQTVLDQAQAVYKVADDNFKDGLSLWLPLLFLVPPALAIGAGFLSRYASRASENKDEKSDAQAEMAYRNNP